MKTKGFISGTGLKLIGAALMVLDHIGLFLPQYPILRIVGRLSFPVFCFMIAEGCKYTRHIWHYFLRIFLLGVLCQLFIYCYDGTTYQSVLITFSLSVFLISVLRSVKKRCLCPSCSIACRLTAMLLFVVVVCAVYLLNRYVEIDYGFWGCLLPVWISLFHGTGKWDNADVQLGMLFTGLVLLSLSQGGIQWYSLLSVPLLALYSGERGRYPMKYFFYLFYPLHLLVLHGIFAYLI